MRCPRSLTFLGAQLGRAPRLRGVGSMKALVSPLRCLLRFLFVTGIVGHDLTAAVPAVASCGEPTAGLAAQGRGRGNGHGAVSC